MISRNENGTKEKCCEARLVIGCLEHRIEAYKKTDATRRKILSQHEGEGKNQQNLIQYLESSQEDYRF